MSLDQTEAKPFVCKGYGSDWAGWDLGSLRFNFENYLQGIDPMKRLKRVLVLLQCEEEN